MGTTRVIRPCLMVLGIVALLTAGSATELSAQPAQPVAVQIDNDDIGGVVTSTKGPEAGVWVIAETTDLGTRFAKSVVTDERGRYVIPDLPQGHVPRVGARLRAGRFAEGQDRRLARS